MGLINIKNSIYNNVRLRVAGIIVLTAIIIALISIVNSYLFIYRTSIKNQKQQSKIIIEYTLNKIGNSNYDYNEEHMNIGTSYTANKIKLNDIRTITQLKSIYTLKRTESGKIIYLLSSFDSFKSYYGIGTEVDDEIYDMASAALDGNVILPDKIISTQDSEIMVAIYPVYDFNKKVIGAMGIEFDASTISRYKDNAIFFCIPLLLIVLLILVKVFISIFNRAMEKFIVKIVYTDNLTDLSNRLAYEKKLESLNNLLENNPNKNLNISIVIYDLNNLKHVNDTLGHLAGDKYISNAAQLIQSCFCKIGINYRIGGDEFATIIQGKTLQEVEDAIATLRQKQDAYNYVSQGAPFVMSIAIGHDYYIKGQDMTLISVIKRADTKMYAEKKAQKREMKII